MEEIEKIEEVIETLYRESTEVSDNLFQRVGI